MARFMGCLFLVLIIAPVLAADEDGKDPSTWTPIRIPSRQRALEFADITAWINSPPLKIYLIDKQGIARWGWTGELSGKGAKGESRMREKIEELLREQADPI